MTTSEVILIIIVLAIAAERAWLIHKMKEMRRDIATVMFNLHLAHNFLEEKHDECCFDVKYAYNERCSGKDKS